jgi:hypothetical protein
MNSYNHYYLNMILIFFVLFGALNTITTTFGFNMISNINDFFSDISKNNLKIDIQLTVIIAFCLIIITFRQTTWLPFLGETVLPSELIPLKNATGDTTINVTVQPNTKVAYWSATPSQDNNRFVTDAYGNYSNSGVVLSDSKGIAKLIFNKGSGYIVPGGKYIKPHIHYRELTNNWGIIGPVKTVFYI